MGQSRGGRVLNSKGVVLVSLRVGAFVLVLATLSGLTSVVLVDPGSSLREALRLPSAEATSLDGILFYGACFDHDAYVWCLDRSCSMGWSGSLESLKAAVSDALLELTPDDEFSLVQYSDTYTAWSSDLRPAEPAEVDDAIDWVLSMSASGITCMIQPISAAIALADDSPNGCVLLVADGAPSCPIERGIESVVPALEAANPESVPIHTFFVSAGSEGLYFLLELAEAFDGDFVATGIPLGRFRRGDANWDGTVDVSDVVFILAAGIVPGSPQPPCLDAADVNDDGNFSAIVDAIVLLQAIFDPSSPPLPSPGALCGLDSTPDSLSCSLACPF